MAEKKSIWTKLADIYRAFEDAFCVGGMMLFGAFIMYEIIVRAFGLPGLSWLQEFSQLMFIIAVFIGCSRAVEKDEHMMMDVLYRVAPEKYTWILRSLVDLLMIVIIGFLTYCACRFTGYTYRKGITLESVAAIKKWIIWIPILLGMITMTFRYIVVFVKRFKENISKYCLKKSKEGGNE